MPQSISTEEYGRIGLRFGDLYEEGIRLIQKYSGDVWTDFNYHDPGVTMLEYVIYSLMDLTYRTNMPIEDLFFLEVDDFDSVRNNLLYPPQDIFHSAPYTTQDYQKMIIDRVKVVKNAWVNPIHDDPYGYKGLLEVLVQSREDLDEDEKRQLEREVMELFHGNRNLGSDLGRLTVLKAVPLTIVGKVNIDVDAIGEYVMAKIYSDLEEYVNPEITFHDPYDLIQAGHATDEVFSGPRPVHGLILNSDLKPKADAFFVSRIRDIVSRVPGVKSIVEIQVLRKGLPVKEDQLTFDSSSYPIIEYQGFGMDPDERIRLLKNNIELEVDPVTTRQLLDFELASRRNNYLGRIQYRRTLKKGRFLPSEIEKHYSMHNELPSVYGQGTRNQVARNESEARKAQSRQLRAYLSFFEQIIANHLAQLRHMRDLLSIEQTERVTYYSQYPEDIPLFEELLEEDVDSYRAYLREISNGETDYNQRVNRVLDHLLARFSEHVNAEALKKLAQEDNSFDGRQAEEGIIQTKIRLLRNIVHLSTSRNTAFNCLDTRTWDSENLSVAEKKIGMSLNIRHVKRRSLVRPLLEWMGMRRTRPEGEPDWAPVEANVDPGGRTTILRMAANAYASDGIRFPRMGVEFVPYLFSHGLNSKFLRIAHTGEGGDARYLLLLRLVDRNQDILLYEDASPENCTSVMGRFRERLQEITRECEGFHMVEHILLRPLEPVLFTFNILDEKGAGFLSGYFPGKMESQSLIADEIPLLGTRQENFSILSVDENMTFMVVLYDSNQQPVARLTKVFNSRVMAEKMLSEACAYLTRIYNREILLSQVLEITNIDNKRAEVPEDFIFSNAVSFVLPAWPSRFQNDEFRQFFTRLVAEHLPAHFTAYFRFLDPERMSLFEDVFHRWLELKARPQSQYKELDLLSVQIMQILTEQRVDNGAR